MKVVASLVLVSLLGACAQKEAEEIPVSAATETADEFVARANAELALLRKEAGAAKWVRATYIT
ncbi:MAG: hypothetical protein OEQ90_07500, partial [Gammaproteobacteria bacterium]|nr:hypothetical protein [Gammaproteobacteria bacterium]